MFRAFPVSLSDFQFYVNFMLVKIILGKQIGKHIITQYIDASLSINLGFYIDFIIEF